MNESNIATTMILSYTTGPAFDSLSKNMPDKDRFGNMVQLRLHGYDKPGWQKHALEEIGALYKMVQKVLAS